MILKRMAMLVFSGLLPCVTLAFDCSAAAKAKARDFIDNEKQFHLGFLPTEQSNPITATLEEDFKRSTLAGVQCLQRGDRQIPITMRHVFASHEFAKLVDSMVATLTAPVPRSPSPVPRPPSPVPHLPRIIFSGCGATSSIAAPPSLRLPSVRWPTVRRPS